tara:strand:+ start:4930 stop:5430 length:501 start_codon:yes stop_codon:yes gene_type:complete
LKLLIQIVKSVKEFILKMLQNLKMVKQNTEVKGVNLLIVRDTFTEVSTIGNLYLDDEWLCDTLELPYLDNQRNISCIPTGQYEVRLRLPRESATRDYIHLLVKDVKDRDYILFHIGNSAKDTRGCVLVGIGTEQDFVKNSTLAMELLVKEILNLGGENINLIIKNK